MKNNNGFYRALVIVLLWVLAAAIAGYLASCSLVDAPIPLDWKYDKPDDVIIDTVPVDTIVVDTITVDSVGVDSCTELTEYTDPAFVTLYLKFDTNQDSVLWEGGGIQSYNLADVVSQITGLQAKIDTSPIGASVLLKGTNNHAQFQLKVFTRIGGAKWYMGTGKQALILPGSNAAYYKETMIEYQSYNQFSFWGVECSCEEGVALSREPLKDCHEGRWYADLFFLPCQPPQSVRDSLALYGWERIRGLQPTYVSDLRALGKVSDEYMANVAKSGNQIIVLDTD